MKQKVLNRVLYFWSDERSLTFFLAFLILYLLVLIPVAREGGVLDIAIDIGLSVILASGLYAMTHSMALRIFIFAFIALYVVLQAFVPAGLIVYGDRIVAILFATALLIVILWQVYKSGPVTSHRIRGAVAGYLLLAVIFSMIYSLLFLIEPDSFRFPIPVEIGKHDFLYFSVVTLTTLGYGDITPVTPLARNFIMIEAFTGQLYPAILIARLVSLAVDPRTQGKGPDSP